MTRSRTRAASLAASLAIAASLLACPSNEPGPQPSPPPARQAPPPAEAGRPPTMCGPEFLLDASGRCVRWRTVGGLQRDRYRATMLPIDGDRLLIVGGMRSPGEPSPEAAHEAKGPYRDMVVYDVARQQMVARLALGDPRMRPVVAMVSARQVLVAGGYARFDVDKSAEDVTFATTYDVIDLVSRARQTRPLPAGRVPLAAAQVTGGGALLLHGSDAHEPGDPVGLWFFDGASLVDVTPPAPMVGAHVQRHPQGALVLSQPKSGAPAAHVWQNRTWHAVTAPPWEDLRRTAAQRLHDGRIVLSNELEDAFELSIFDPRTDRWETLPQLTADFDTGIVATADGGLLVSTGAETAHRYMPATKTWKALAWDGDWMSRLLPGTASAGVVYASYSRALIAVDPETLRPKPGPFSGMRGTPTVGAPRDGRIVIGHRRGEGPTQVAAFELATGSWVATTEPPPKARALALPAGLPIGPDRKDFGFVHLPDGRLLLSGGTGSREFYDDSWLHDPKRNVWTRAADLPDRYYHHGMAMLDDGAVLAVDHHRQAVIYDVKRNVWLPTVPPPRALGTTTLTRANPGRVLAIGDSILTSRAAMFEVERSFGDSPAVKAVSLSTNAAHVVELSWEHAAADRAWAKCEARDLYKTPKRRTCAPLEPTKGTLALAFAEDASREGVQLTPVLKARRSVHDVMLSQHVHRGSLTRIDTFARLSLAQTLGPPRDGSAPFSTETLESNAVIVANTIGTDTFDLINRPMRVRGLLDADGSMRDVKVDGANQDQDPRRAVSQALGRLMRLARPVAEADKTYAVGQTWSAPIQLGLGDLMKTTDPSVQVQQDSSAVYHFAGWRRRGGKRLAAITIRGRVTALADVPGVVGGTRIAAVLRTLATLYWDPEVGEPAYVELIATAALHSGDDKFGLQTIGRFFSLRRDG